MCWRRPLAIATVLALSLLGFSETAAAQAGAGDERWLYGISFGAGRRTTDGTFAPSTSPSGPPQLPSPRNVGALDIEGGIKLTSRIAVVGLWELRASLGQSSSGWGINTGHAGVRAWVAPRVWIGGGVGPAELAYRSTPASVTTRWWTTGVEASGGYDIFRGPTVTLNVLGRYTMFTIEGLRVNTFTIEMGLLGRR